MAVRLSDKRTREGVAARLIITRQALRMGQRDFAEKAGLAASTYNQYETGKNFPKLDSAHALCDTYGLTLDWIYRGDQSGLRYALAEAIKALRNADN